MLRGVLDDLLGQETADAVAFNALTRSGRHAVPSDAPGFVMFVLGPLDNAIERLVGRGIADAVLDALDGILDEAHDAMAPRMVSGIAPKSQPPQLDHDSGVHRIVTPRVPHGDASLARTALVVHNDPTERHAMASALQNCGMRVVMSADGHMALALCVRYMPDVVVAINRMPGVSGEQLSKSISLALGDAAPPLVLLSDELVELPTSAAAVLSTDVDHDVLFGTIAETLH